MERHYKHLDAEERAVLRFDAPMMTPCTIQLHILRPGRNRQSIRRATPCQTVRDPLTC